MYIFLSSKNCLCLRYQLPDVKLKCPVKPKYSGNNIWIYVCNSAYMFCAWIEDVYTFYSLYCTLYINMYVYSISEFIMCVWLLSEISLKCTYLSDKSRKYAHLSDRYHKCVHLSNMLCKCAYLLCKQAHEVYIKSQKH